MYSPNQEAVFKKNEFLFHVDIPVYVNSKVYV